MNQFRYSTKTKSRKIDGQIKHIFESISLNINITSLIRNRNWNQNPQRKKLNTVRYLEKYNQTYAIYSYTKIIYKQFERLNYENIGEIRLLDWKK